jgi:hypothetical protein
MATTENAEAVSFIPNVVLLGHFDRVTEQHAGTATKPREKNDDEKR